MFAGPPSVLAEVRAAEESARVLDLLGLGLVDAAAAAAAEAVGEAAQERAAIRAADGVGVVGLVSVQTTPKTGVTEATATQAKALRRHMRAVEPDARAARVAGLRRAVGFNARAIGAASDRPGFRAGYVAMMTLTYHDADGWRPDHLTRCLDLIRKHLKSRRVSMRYVWVGELQKRGALHYHVALWLPHGVLVPKPDAQGWWPHGSSNVVTARNAVPYLMKYLSKSMHTHGFPHGARIHGAGGVEFALRRARRWLGLPGFVRARSDVLDDWRRVSGGGWSDPDGVCIPPEFERAWVGDRWTFVQVADYGRPFPADGPFTWLWRRPEAA